MSPRVRTALISVVGFVVTFAIVLTVGSVLRDEAPETDALTVDDAGNVPSGERLAVRGHVFFDEVTGPLLCSRRTGGDPPACDGTVLRLQNLDPNRLDLVRPQNTEGAYDAYSRGEVALLGVKHSGVLVVEDVLR